VVILLSGAGLLLRSYVNVEAEQPGFSSSTVSMSLQLDAQYQTGEQSLAFFRSLLGKIESIPGIQSVGVVNALPFSNSESLSSFWVEGYANQKEQLVNDRNITPHYLDAMGIPLVEGRSFTDDDAPGRPIVAMLNQAFARKYFGNRDPVGERIRTSGPTNPWRMVIGVVKNEHYSSLESAAVPEIHEPLWQNTNAGIAYVAIRSSLPPGNVVNDVRAVLRTINSDLALGDIHTMGDLISHSTARRRFQTILMTAFSAMAMLLGIVGIYGLVAWSVKQRTPEIGLRIALGASRQHVLGLILLQGLRLTLFGLLMGFVIDLALTRILAASLYGVGAFDPITFVAVPAVLLLSASVACLIPAPRAASVDPMRTLRYE
jgi:predicted permease